MERKDLTYTDAIKICFSKFADFSGRAASANLLISAAARADRNTGTL